MTTDLPQYTGAEDERFDIAVSKNKKSKAHRHWDRLRWTWPGLVDRALNPIVGEPEEVDSDEDADEATPLKKASDRVKYAAGGALAGRLNKGPAATDCRTMPCEGFHKTSKTVAYRTFIAMDADTPDDEFVDRVKGLGLRALVYPTASSTPEDPRYRVWIYPGRATTQKEYETATWELQWLIDQDRADGLSSFDDCSHEASRTMYLPAVLEDRHDYYAANVHELPGDLLDVDGLLEAAAASDSPPVGGGRRGRLGSDAEPYYDDSPERPESEGVHPEAKKMVSAVLMGLFELGMVPWEKGAQWDLKARNAAADLIRIGNSNWTGYHLDDLRDMFFANAPEDDEWGHDQHVEKWRAARAQVGGAGLPYRRSTAEMFGVIEATPDTRGVVSAQVAEALRKDRTVEKILPPPFNPALPAEVLLDQYIVNGCVGLRTWNGQAYEHAVTHWQEIPDTVLNARIHDMIDGAIWEGVDKKGRPEMFQWNANDANVREIRNAVKRTAWAMIMPSVQLNSWFECADGTCDVNPDDKDRRWVSFQNGLYDVLTGDRRDHSPQFFNLSSRPFDYLPDCPPPSVLMQVLADYWPGEEPGTVDQEAIDAFQEQGGFLVFGTNEDMFKAMVVFEGPGDCGKSLVTDMLAHLLPMGAVVGLEGSTFAEKFGKEVLLGADIGVFTEADFTGRGGKNTPVIKAITGWDNVNVNRKGKTDWSGKLPTRLLAASNNPLDLRGDPSGTIANRVHHSVWANSIPEADRDPLLLEKIMEEQTAVGMWFLQGYLRAKERGRIAVSAAGLVKREELRANAAPLAAWWTECVERGTAKDVIKTDDAVNHFNEWCTDRGDEDQMVLTNRAFLNLLAKSVPGVHAEQKKLPGERTNTRGFHGWKFKKVEKGETEE